MRDPRDVDNFESLTRAVAQSANTERGQLITDRLHVKKCQNGTFHLFDWLAKANASLKVVVFLFQRLKPDLKTQI
jgi:hypothetical protein